MNKKLYIVLILILTIAFSTKAIANLTLGTTSVTSNGPLTLSTSSSTLILPSTNGTNGQVLTTNGAGTTSWSTVSGGGITNGAGANIIPKSDGVNFGPSTITDDGNVKISSSLFVLNDFQVGTDGSTDPIFQAHPETGATIIAFGDLAGSGNNTKFDLHDETSTITINAANGVFINGVKKYIALLTQTGTSAPVATVLENTLGGTVVWSRNGVGDYVGTLNEAFTANKTWCIVGITGTQANSSLAVGCDRTNSNMVTLTVPAGDDSLASQSVEIRVYP